MKRENVDYYLNLFFGALIVILSVYVLSFMTSSMRLDFTEGEIYTMADGSKKILEDMNGPVKVEVYISQTDIYRGVEGKRKYYRFYRYLIDILQQYEKYGQGRLQVKINDTKIGSSEETKALEEGCKEDRVNEMEKYHSCIVIENQEGEKRAISYLGPEKKGIVEYLLNKNIFRLTNKKKRVIGVLTKENVVVPKASGYLKEMLKLQRRERPKSWQLASFLEEKQYEIKRIDNDAKQIDRVDVLIVIRPERLKNDLLVALEEYIQEGKEVIILTDPKYKTGYDFDGHVSKFEKLMASWGLEVNTLQDKRTTDGSVTLKCDIFCSKETESPVAREFGNLVFINPGYMTIKKDAKANNLERIPIISKNDLWIMVEVKGIVKAILKDEEKKEKQREKKMISVTLISDVDFITDKYVSMSEESNDNLKLLQNIIEKKVYKEYFADLKSKKIVNRDLRYVQ